MTDYRSLITLEPGKRSGKPCIRGLRITVQDVLGWLASGMETNEILHNYPELTKEDVMACLAYAADNGKHAGDPHRRPGPGCRERREEVVWEVSRSKTPLE